MNYESNDASLFEREFHYEHSRGAIVFWSFFFAISALVFTYECAVNDRGLVINEVIPFTPFGATVFYGFVAGASMFCVGLGVRLSFRRGRIAFGKDGFLMPKPWWSFEEKYVPYRDLRGFFLRANGSAITGASLLYVKHERGVECLTAAMFSSHNAFDEFRQLLIEKKNQHEVPDAVG